jgi:hypothetical protein
MSNNKNLLNENTIRRFMKLASLAPLADSTVKKVIVKEETVEEGWGGKKGDDDPEAMTRGDKPHSDYKTTKRGDLTMGDMPAYMQEDEAEELYADAEEDAEGAVDDLALVPDDDLETADDVLDNPEGEMDAAEGEVEMADKEALAVDVMDAVAAALDAALGTVTTVVGGDEEPGLELDDTEVVDLDGPVDLDEPELDLPVDDLEIEDEEEEEVMEEAAVNQIVDRVAARLTQEVKADKKDQLAESLADKIFARLTEKSTSK